MSEQAQSAEAQQSENSQPNGDGAGGESPKAAEKLFTQTELDAIISDRLKRAEDKAKAAEAKAKEKAAADALAEQGEFKKLSETQAKQLLDLTAEKETWTTEREALQEKVTRYETALNGLLAEHIKGVPDAVKTLLERLDPVEQLNWIAANQGAYKTAGVPLTPKADGRALNAAQREAAQKATDRFYRDGF